MKRILFGLLLLAGMAQAQTTTNLHLNTPAKGASNWDSSLNANFTTLDTKLGALSGSTTLQNLLDQKSPLASPNFTGTVTLPVTGSTQCLHVNSAGVLSGSGGDCSSGGLGDPGSNGLIKRTSLNTTGSAAGSDVIALWTGTCSSTTYLRGDGSCQNPPGGGNVSNSGTPTTGQIPVWQSSTTQSGVTNVSFPGDAYFKGRPWVDVRNYGAVGNGSTDDLAAFNSAVAAAANLGTISGNPFGAIVYVPSGSYAFSDRIVLPKGVSNTFGHGTVSIIGGGKTNTAFLALSSFPSGHCLIEWTTATTGRVLSQTIQGITFKDTTVDKQCDIGYAYSATNSPATTSNATNERMERLTIQDVEFQGSNQYQDKHLKLVGDCYDCRIDVETNDSRGSVHNYDTIAVFIDDCYTSTAPNNETCGFTYGEVKVNTVGNRGGYMAAFNGRMNQGSVGGFSNGVYNTNAWRISNSFFPELSLITEGLGGQPEVSVINTMGATFKRLDIGAPSNEGGGSGDGADFVNSSNNTILHASAANGASSAWSQQTTMTTYSGLTAGTGYTSGPTWTGSGGACLTQPSGTTTLSGGGVATLVVVNAGLCQTGHAPTIGFTGGGGSGAAATPTMTAAGLFHLKFDSNSVNNTGWDIHTNGGTGEISLSNTTKNLLQTCDQSSSLCNAYTAMGTLSGVAITGNAGTATALAANGANCGAGMAPLGVDASGAVEGCFTPAGLVASVFGQTGAVGNLSGAITTSGSSVTTVPAASVIFQKSINANAMLYASPQGNDSNDCLGWGSSSCLTIMGAYAKLPRGTFGGGTIFIANNTVANSATCTDSATGLSGAAGIWLVGVTDPNYSSPPCGFAQADVAAKFSGISSNNNPVSGPNAHMPRTYINGGSSVDRNHPGIWITGSGGNPYEFDNLAVYGPQRPILIGETTTHLRTAAGATAGLTFFNTTGTAPQTIGAGPGWDITGQSFWIWMDHIGAGGTDSVNDPSGDLAPAILLDGVGLINITNANTAGGTVKFYESSNGGGFYLNNLTSEAIYSAASVWIAGFTKPATDLVQVNYVQTADPLFNGILAANVTSGHAGSGYSVGNTGTIAGCTSANYTITGVSGGAVTAFTFSRGQTCTIANGVATAVTTGGGNGAFQIDITAITGSNPVDVLSSATYNSSHFSNSIMVSNTNKTSGVMTSLMESEVFQNTVSPLAQGKVGFFSGRVVGQQDSARRGFGPVAVRYANLATMPPTTNSGSGTITTGVSAPDGTTNAATITSTSGTYDAKFYRATITPAVGDWFIAGVWAHAATSNGFRASPGPDQVASIGITGTNTLTGITTCTPAWYGNQEWAWVWCAAKITASSSNGDFIFNASVTLSPNTATSFYGPTVLRIPSGTISDNEVWELVQNLQPYDASCAVGTICGLAGQTLYETNFSSKTSIFNGSGSGSTTVQASSTASGTLTLPAATDTLVARATTDTLTNKTLTSPVLGGTPDASGATHFKLPVAAGYAAIANGNLGYDTTNKNWHAWSNAVDNLVAVLPASITPANNDCVKFTLASGVYTLNTAGAACGAGGGAPAWSSITDAAGALTLSNAANATTFNQTSAVNWSWLNTTAATSSTVSNSPVFIIGQKTWNGASVDEQLTSTLITGTGSNAAVTQTWAASGSTGGTTFNFKDTSAATLTARYINLQQGSSTSIAMQAERGGTGQANSIKSFGGPVALLGLITGGNNTNAAYVQMGADNANITSTSGTVNAVQIGASSDTRGMVVFTPSSGNAKFVGLNIAPTINQTGTSSGDFTALQVNLTETAVLGTNKLLADFQVGASSKYKVDDTGSQIQALGAKKICTHGSNSTCGVSTLSSGTVTVSTTAIAALAAAGAAGDVVSLTLQTCSSCGTLSVGTVTGGTSFVINSTNGADASNVYWEIRHVN